MSENPKQKIDVVKSFQICYNLNYALNKPRCGIARAKYFIKPNEIMEGARITEIFKFKCKLCEEYSATI